MAEANKIILNGQTLVDLTQDTATAADVVQGKTFHNAAGEQVQGTYVNQLAGVLDGTATSIVCSDYGVTSLAASRFMNFTNLQSLDLTGVTNIPSYTAYECRNLTTIIVDPNTTNIGDYAFTAAGVSGIAFDIELNNQPCVLGNSVFYAYNVAGRIRKLKGNFSSINTQCCQYCRNLTEVELGPALTSIGSYAFFGCSGLTSFKLDKNINLSQLSNQCFAFGITSNNIRLTIDLRNSSFTSDASAFYRSNGSFKNLDIFFPSSVTTTSTSNNSFQGATGVNIYWKSVPTLTSTGSFSGASIGNYKNFFPYNLVQTAKTATNWSSSTNGIVSSIYGWAEENTFSQGDTLPATNTGGYALTWYSDVALTNQVTTVGDPTQIYYCAVGAQVATPLTILEYQATVAVSDGTNTYVSGQLIPFNTTITITAIGQGANTTPYIFTLNGTTISSGDTYTVTSSDASLDIACYYYDGVNIPFEPTFSNNTPAQIKYAVDNGLHRLWWNIGDTTTITLTDNSTATIRYVDQQVNRYQKSDLTGYSNAVFEFTTLPMSAQMNTSGTNAGGWPASAMCTVTMPQIYDLLPSDWKVVFSQGRIPSATSTGDSTIVYADNVSFIPSGQEMYGAQYVNSYYYDEGCAQFDYYRINSSNSYKIKQRNGSNYNYWLRSPSRNSSGNYCSVSNNGSFSYDYATFSFGVSVCLII